MKILIFFILLLSLKVWAVAETSIDPDALEKARQRSYPGGVDESQLKVQDPLPVPLKKLNTKNIQKQIYKSLFEEEMKEDPTSPESEPPTAEGETTEG